MTMMADSDHEKSWPGPGAALSPHTNLLEGDIHLILTKHRQIKQLGQSRRAVGARAITQIQADWLQGPNGNKSVCVVLHVVIDTTS